MTQDPEKQPEESSLATLEKTLISASEISENYQSALATIENKFLLAIRTATAVSQLRKIMEHRDVIRLLRGLAGTSLGFLTDKHHMEYPDQILADCATEAILRGFNLTGNEFNIIASRPYFTKIGLQRKVREFPGLDGTYDEVLDLPEILFTNEGKIKGAKVKCTARWKMKSKEDSIERTYAIKGDKFTGADAFIGKAARKLARDVLARLQGQETPEGDVDDLPSDDERTAKAKRAYVIETQTMSAKAQSQTSLPEENEVTAPAHTEHSEEVPSVAPALDEVKPSDELRARIEKLIGSEETFLLALHVLNPAMPENVQAISDLSASACDKYLRMSDSALLGVLEKAEVKNRNEEAKKALHERAEAAAVEDAKGPFELE